MVSQCLINSDSDGTRKDLPTAVLTAESTLLGNPTVARSRRSLNPEDEEDATKVKQAMLEQVFSITLLGKVIRHFHVVLLITYFL